MAKNWTITEVANSIKNNDMESMLDFGKRYPITTNLLTAILATATHPFVIAFFNVFPEYITAEKIEKMLKSQIEDGTFGTPSISCSEDIDEDEDADESIDEDIDDNTNAAKEAAKPIKATEKKPKIDEDIKLKTGKELYQMCLDAGYLAKEIRGKSKAELIEMFNKKSSKETTEVTECTPTKPTNKYDGKSAKELYKMCKDAGLDIEQKKTAEYYIEFLEKENDEADEEVDYSKMSAKELYNVCKEKGLKPEQKMPNKYYIGLLEETDEDEGEGDWGEDDEPEEEEVKPTKPGKVEKSTEKPSKSADDEWEI